MELLYLHIAEHYLFPGADLNFGGSHLFTYPADNKGLEVRPNPFYIDHFFVTNPINGREKANIINITGIVGKNGSGKSVLLNFLLEILPVTMVASGKSLYWR